MSILENQTSTDDDFITDFRGWVWGLTDDSGTLVESYNYDPFGRMLAGSLLSHARFLSGAHEGQWEHCYLYCQNDPVSLIDPTGYSPENTGTPPRFTLGNVASYRFMQGGSSSCYLPDINASLHPYGSNMSIAEAHRNADAQEESRRRNDALMGVPGSRSFISIFDSNDGCILHYTWVFIGGILIKVVYNDKGQITWIESNSLEGLLLGLAIRMALKAIQDEGGITSAAELRWLLESVNSFALANYSTFKKIFNSDDGSARFSFAYHAMIGGYVATQMQKYGLSSDGYNYDQFDMSFGFWASFWASRSGLQIGILPDYEGTPTANTRLSLVDVANLSKAIGYQESRLGSGKGTHTGTHRGIMQVLPDAEKDGKGNWDFNCPTFREKYGAGLTFKEGSGGMENNFNNIGIGVGMLYAKMIRYSEYSYSEKGWRHAPEMKYWEQAVYRYYGDIPRKPSEPTATEYSESVMSILIKGQWIRHTDIHKTTLFDAAAYYKGRRRR